MLSRDKTNMGMKMLYNTTSELLANIKKRVSKGAPNNTTAKCSLYKHGDDIFLGREEYKFNARILSKWLNSVFHVYIGTFDALAYL